MGERAQTTQWTWHTFIHKTWLSPCHHCTKMHMQFAQRYTVNEHPASTLGFLL